MNSARSTLAILSLVFLVAVPAAAQDGRIYYSSGRGIWAYNMDGTGGRPIPATLEFANVFYSEYGPTTSTEQFPTLAIDSSRGQLYRSQEEFVVRSNLDGTEPWVMPFVAESWDIYLEVSPESGHLYIVDRSGGRLVRTDLAGVSVETLISGPYGLPQEYIQFVAVDDRRERLYWVSRRDDGVDTHSVYTAELDASDPTLLYTLQEKPRGFVVDRLNGDLYWLVSVGPTDMRYDESNPQFDLVKARPDSSGTTRIWTDSGWPRFLRIDQRSSQLLTAIFRTANDPVYRGSSLYATSIGLSNGSPPAPIAITPDEFVHIDAAIDSSTGDLFTLELDFYGPSGGHSMHLNHRRVATGTTATLIQTSESLPTEIAAVWGEGKIAWLDGGGRRVRQTSGPDGVSWENVDGQRSLRGLNAAGGAGDVIYADYVCDEHDGCGTTDGRVFRLFGDGSKRGNFGTPEPIDTAGNPNSNEYFFLLDGNKVYRDLTDENFDAEVYFQLGSTIRALEVDSINDGLLIFTDTGVFRRPFAGPPATLISPQPDIGVVVEPHRVAFDPNSNAFLVVRDVGAGIGLDRIPLDGSPAERIMDLSATSNTHAIAVDPRAPRLAEGPPPLPPAQELGGPVPTVSEWGLAAMSLLVLVAGTMVIRRSSGALAA